MHNGFRSIAEIIEKEPALNKLRDSIKKYDVVDEFKKIFPELVKIAEPVKTERKILQLRVENSVWKSELKFNEKLIVEKVNKYFKEDRIKGIKFVS